LLLPAKGQEFSRVPRRKDPLLDHALLVKEKETPTAWLRIEITTHWVLLLIRELLESLIPLTQARP
jgi:hypothetical protein